MMTTMSLLLSLTSTRLLAQCDFSEYETISLVAGGSPASGYTNVYILTNYQGNILEIKSSPVFSGQTAGMYIAYHLNYKTSSGITGLSVGANISNVYSPCFSLSAPLALRVCKSLSTCDYTPLTNASFGASGGNNGAGFSNKYILTNSSGTILSISDNLNFGNLAAGKYIVYNLNYKTSGNLNGLAVNNSINQVSGTCINLSAPLAFSVCSSNTISGTVFDDTNGLADLIVNGSGTNSGSLYVVLTDVNGVVLTSVAVNADGTYNFSDIPDGTYRLLLYNEVVAPGVTLSAAGPSSDWITTGENIGAGAGNDGLADGILTVIVSSANITNANFGLQHKPIRNISGTVYLDEDCLTDNQVDGTPGNGGVSLYVNFVNSLGKVDAIGTVAENGEFTIAQAGLSSGTLRLSSVEGVVGADAPANQLDGNWNYSGETIGNAGGGDGNPDGMLAISAGTSNISLVKFGLNQLPVANNVEFPAGQLVYPGQPVYLNMYGSTLSGQDQETSPDDMSMSFGSTFKISSLPPADAGYLTYEEIPLNAGDFISSFDPNSFAFVGARLLTAGETVCFNYTIADACGSFDPSPASFCLLTVIILPVTGLQLSAAQYQNGTTLTWRTLTETNASYFMLERKEGNNPFTAISTKIPAAGNSASSQTYHYQDNDKKTGDVMYRVKLYDRNGKITLSNIVNTHSSNSAGIRVYPNPVLQRIGIEFAEPGNYFIEILNQTGQQVWQRNNVMIMDKTFKYGIDKGTMPAGFYVLRIVNRQTGEVKTEKLQLLDR